MVYAVRPALAAPIRFGGRSLRRMISSIAYSDNPNHWATTESYSRPDCLRTAREGSVGNRMPSAMGRMAGCRQGNYGEKTTKASANDFMIGKDEGAGTWRCLEYAGQITCLGHRGTCRPTAIARADSGYGQ